MLYSSNRIYIIGMMGVGKSTLGKQLAKQLHFSFIDLDKLIEKIASLSIAEIFAQYGEAYFRKLEQEALYQTANRNHIVIATGGGTPCFYNNIEWMNEHGKTIYLKATDAFIHSRIMPNASKRPLLAHQTEEQIKATISQLLGQRELYYSQAQMQVNMPIKSLLDIVKTKV
jgi:shikimate kinase